MLKGITLVLASLITASVASAKMSAQEVAYMQATIAVEQEKINAQQVFVSKLRTEVSKKQQSVAIDKGLVRAAQWTTIPIAIFEMGVLTKAFIEEGHRVYQLVIKGLEVPGTKVNIRQQVIVASLAMAAYYGSDAYNQNYVVVQTKDLGLLEGQLKRALDILAVREGALSKMQIQLNEEL
jgi:hypothetical protein